MKTFVEVGQALARIRDGKKYKAVGFSNFEGYCKERWGMSRTYAFNTIESAKAVNSVLNCEH
jgi:hypothetical protein